MGVWLDWDIEYTEQFLKWWHNLKEEEQITVDASIRLLEHFGPNLRFPYSSGIAGSKIWSYARIKDPASRQAV